METPAQKALREAVDENDKTKLKAALSQRPNINEIMTVFNEPLFHGVVNTQSEEMIRLFLEHGKTVPSSEFDINIPDFSGGTAIITPAIHGNERIVRLLLEHGATPNEASAGGFSALHAAARCKSIDTANILLQYGANVNAIFEEDLQNDHGNVTPLHRAALHRNLPMITLLVAYGADIDKKMKDFIMEDEVTAREIYTSDPAHADKGADFDKAVADGLEQKKTLDNTKKDAQPHQGVKRSGESLSDQPSKRSTFSPLTQCQLATSTPHPVSPRLPGKTN